MKMNCQWLFISMILIVLSLVHINASNSQRQNINTQCPDVNLCDYIQCENGQCVDDRTSIDCYKCLCNAGFTGPLCDTPIPTPNGCNPPCQNGAECQQTALNTFACVCPPEFTGNQCETSLLATHPCVIMPGTVCLNGGTCTVNGGSFLCICPIGWTGTNCETQHTLTTCNPNPCGTHGSCQQVTLPNNALAVFCICEGQWTGKYCDVNLANNCPVGFCQSGGTCQMNGNIPYCLCPSTHTGQKCETLVAPLLTTTPVAITTTATITTTVTGTFNTTGVTTVRPISGSCTSSPCSNGGTCFNTGNDFICLCKSQYSGPTCNIQNSVTTPALTTPSSTNACAPNPCNNGGACYKHNTGFVCVCTAQYTGQTCDMVKTTAIPTITTPSSAITCANQPCQNGATCYATSNSYFCFCGGNSNFTGKNCETPKVTSDPNCPLDCSPGYCIRTGGRQDAYACMCNGALTPTSCSSK